MAESIAAEILADPIANYPTATVAAFDPTAGTLPRRKLDAPATRDYLERLAEAGAPAVLIASSTGHGHLRTTAELAEWFTVAAEARCGDMLKMALLRPEDGLPASESLLDLLKAKGYAVVFVRPGTNLSPTASASEVAVNVQPLVAAAAERGLPIGV
jgi:hypothetical protein